jgi:Tol biopolymer transport system component/serine/threonine protein kinase
MIGETVAGYRVIQHLGGGGMGEVYKAKDLRLGRKVAIKFLPEDMLHVATLVDRFRREARAASLLNHPHICKIFDVGEHRGQPYLVMELMDGETLDARLRKGPIAVTDLLEIAAQSADALDAAHRVGILHRDIKPSNIFLTRHGAKLLDFGLAKLPEDIIDEDSAGTLTQPGALLGTIAYMSPEQALGEKLDARSDLFSFGALLYEMATRQQPFRGQTPAAIFEAILHKPLVPADRLNPQIPPDVAGIIAKALERDIDKRYQTAQAMRADLKRARKQSDSDSADITLPIIAAPPAVRKRRVPWTPVIATAAVCLIAGGAWYGGRLYGWRVGGSRGMHVSFRQITNDSGQELFPSLSPDGKTLAYAAMSNSHWDIFLRRVDGANPINLTANTAGGGTQPAFSPDGDRIAFRGESGGGGIFVMGATGEAIRRLTDKGYHPAWSPDGKQIVYSTRPVIRPDSSDTGIGELWIVNLADGAEARFLGGDATQPSWSPDRAHIAYWKRAGDHSEIWTASVHDKKAAPAFVEKATNWNPVWSPDGKYLYFPSDRAGSMNLWRVRAGTPPQAFTTPAPYSGHLSFSRDGRRLAYVQHEVTSNVARFEIGGSRTPVYVTRGNQGFLEPNLSADGKLLVLRHESPGRRELAAINADGSGLRVVLDDAALTGSPAWSPDGRMIAFVSARSKERHVWVVNADGSGLRMISPAGESDAWMPVWSPTGDRIAYSTVDGKTRIVELISARVFPIAATFVATSWSPDGKQLAGYDTGVVIFNLANRSTTRIAKSGRHPVWHKDTLVFYDDNKLYQADVSTYQIQELAGLGGLTANGRPSISPDGRYIYLSLTSAEADIWLASFE